MELLIKLIPPTLFLLFLVSLFYVVNTIKKYSKQVERDWETLDDLEKRSKEVKTKEEIEELHKEFQEKSKKIHNQFITPRLFAIDGYLRGIYKQYK